VNELKRKIERLSKEAARSRKNTASFGDNNHNPIYSENEENHSLN